MGADHRTPFGRGIRLVWPAALLVPNRPPALVYLDLNHWINLAKASLDRGSEPYAALLATLRKKRADGSIRLVLSSNFAQEFSAVPTPRQRRDVVDVIEELTDFDYLASLSDVMKLEIETFLDAKLGVSGERWLPVPLLGRSMLHAMGRVGGLRIHDEAGVEITDSLRASDPNFPGHLIEMERLAERMLLQGPEDSDIAGLRANGYQPEIPRISLHNNMLLEQLWADERLDEHWRKGRLLDLVAARHVFLEMNGALWAALRKRGSTLEELAGLCDPRVELPLAMPTSAVWVGLKTKYHQDANKRWSDNDLHDIEALAIALPYCDIVFTDAAARSAIVDTKLNLLTQTLVPRTPSELSAILEQLPSAET